MEGKDQYIKKRLHELTNYWIGTILVLGTFLFLVLGVMDYLVTPEKFVTFFILRTAIASILLLFFLALRVFRKTSFVPLAIIIIGTVLSAATIEIMILNLGGHGSFYYAGFNLLVICVLGFVPLNLTISTVCVVMIYLIYLVPILIFDTITNVPLFFSNNAFLVSTFIIALVWRSLNQKNLINTLGLQYELAREKEQLRHHSTHLEQLVEERTRELNKSELMYRSLFEFATDGTIIMDLDGTILNANQKACELHSFDREALVGTNITLLETEESKPFFRERMERILAGESLIYETRHYRKDGSKIHLEVSARALDMEGGPLIQAFYRDITEKKKLQRQIVHSQKMDSIGLLAGGVAHDFNNVLTSVLGFAELILMKEKLDAAVHKYARNIENVARKAVQMVSKLLSFARRGGFEPAIFNINSVVNDTLDIVSRLIPGRTLLIREFCEPSPVVEGDPSQLEQVLMNLVINARDAMPEGGEIAVRSSLVELGPEDLDIGADVARGTYVDIRVSDTGIGIPEEHLPHIFEPFYTTKKGGKGTGLGLAMVYGIVKEHRGYVTVKSTPRQGTAFDIYLPVSTKRVPAAEALTTPNVNGNETILVIDDEMPILEFIKETLQARGFTVITSEDAVDGLALYRRNPAEFNLVITDIAMPVMSGLQFIESIREINPGARVLAITALNEDMGAARIEGILKKPFTGSKLLLTIRDILDRASDGGG